MTNTNPTDGFAYRDDREEHILVHFNEDFAGTSVAPDATQEIRKMESDTQNTARTAAYRKSRGSLVSRHMSRRREQRERQTKLGITLDTSFTRHKGKAPHEVFPGDGLNSKRLSRKPTWLTRSSMKYKGLGITRGTPQPNNTHRRHSSIDHDEPMTTDSLQSGIKPWQDISPWDRPIPIGISIPTDSVSDFSTYRTSRFRAGSDATLVTPSIIITPAAAMQSANSDVTELPRHSRNDTLDSAGTAFEEDDDMKRRERIMSTSTFFEEDVTPLRERTIESTLNVETPMVPTPRRSQGWWNFITTPFVTTPRSAVWPQYGRDGDRTPDVPTVPAPHLTTTSPSTYIWSATEKSPSFSTNASVAVIPSQSSTPQAITSPFSSMSATPVVGTAAIGTILMPRQVEEQPRAININIELQDRRPDTNFRLADANSPANNQHSRSSSPASRLQGVGSSSTQSQSLPVFAPPPTFSRKGSHFSYDHSGSSSVASSPDLKKTKKHRKVSNMMGLFSCNKRKQQSNTDEKKKKKRGWCFWCCGCCLVLVVLMAVIIPVVVVFTKHHDKTPTGTQPGQEVGSQWLNLTNYPAIPTGISTISQPEAVEEQSGCVAPTTLWSCALPKELQDSVKPNKPDQPNFKIEITFDNSTTATPSSTQLAKRVANPVSASAFIRSRILNVRSVPSPSPAPPSDQDMKFIGETTDGNNAPYEGEDTPLFVTFQDPRSTASRLLKRASSDPTNITSVIPPPLLNSDGTAAPANLLPLPFAQPLRLYNRGLDTEHYGFYTYFDRSIFLKSINDTNRGGSPADTDGGSNFNAATLRCTFSETRFLVQIWTRSAASKPLLQSATQNATDAYKRPGTFPYPVTVTIDRHGGNAAKKNLYCYNVETDGTIKNKASKRFFQFEDRAFGGNLVNGTQGRQVVTGPIDGGSGGCGCQWQNWLN
ncbi:hypothetical protein P153DRAFT_309610 [Dothidotthia symphoricarpi CBS 119687]|uniref:Glycoprotease family protein n=1 Tax=Dothidotthia symphoricarpi CBS 119687 TaxID=1392245 RepID=A0A6A6APK7_9PLEO|nr:uncharacterized protein P153DRAFT_309610 [Dothidotthia symphoricarpi CBS 119687]KAF2132874.1 hypothetical protein P153DRAFT_309610 [Dothidotthia symphoricarpi CBS 119687]